MSSFENTKNSILIWIFGFLVLVSGCATTYNPKQNSFEVVLIDESTDIPYTLTTNFNFNFKEDVPGRQGIASDELLFPLNKNNLYYGYLFINSDKPNEESIIGYWKQDTTIFELDAWLGKQDKIKANSKEDYYITVNKKDIRNLNIYLEYNGPITAPVDKGTEVAKIVVYNKDEKIKELPLFAAEDLKKVNFFKSLLTSLNYMIWGDV